MTTALAADPDAPRASTSTRSETGTARELRHDTSRNPSGIIAAIRARLRPASDHRAWRPVRPNTEAERIARRWAMIADARHGTTASHRPRRLWTTRP